MSTSSGPAAYFLPSLVGHSNHDPRSVHVRGPAYQFGLKLGTAEKRFGPGPGQYHINPNVQINGLEYGPSYSLAMRLGTKDKFRSPGPAAYYRDNHFVANRPAAYTFGVKHRADTQQNIPGSLHMGRGREEVGDPRPTCEYLVFDSVRILVHSMHNSAAAAEL